MKNLKTFVALASLICFGGCLNGQTQTHKTQLTATEYSNKISEAPKSPIIDVRSPEEFSKGHLQNAKNYNWNGVNFEKQIESLDKSKPVFVYCLSGGRSSSAANKMRSEGFKEVYELDGGILKWRAANLPEIIDSKAKTDGMSKGEFDALTTSEKLVLVDFYADWCGPCKKMKHYLEEIASDMAEKVTVIRINIDDNQQLCKELKIDVLPVLQLYKNNAIIWANTGYISKEDVLKKLN